MAKSADAIGQGLGRNTAALDRFLGMPVQNSATGVLAINLGALQRNYITLESRLGGGKSECAGVIKADGYGTGALEAAQALHAVNCKTLFVATLSEAEQLARHGYLSELAIYVLDGLLPGSAEAFASLGVHPVLNSLAELEEWTSFCKVRGDALPAALHIDTGMNRLGLKAADRSILLNEPRRIQGANIALIMSHLACADEPDHPKNILQKDDFDQIAQSFPDIPLSLANSAGIFLGPDYHHDLVRPGIALYGGNPFADKANPMEPVARLFGRILQVGEAASGETVGYGATQKLTRNTRYATVATGYADGYFRSLSSSDEHPGAIGNIDGTALPLLGRISMDLIVFDVTDLPEDDTCRGGFIELIGPQFTIDQMGAKAGSFAYEMLTSLGKRYQRIYYGAEGALAHG